MNSFSTTESSSPNNDVSSSSDTSDSSSNSSSATPSGSDIVAIRPAAANEEIEERVTVAELMAIVKQQTEAIKLLTSAQLVNGDAQVVPALGPKLAAPPSDLPNDSTRLVLAHEPTVYRHGPKSLDETEWARFFTDFDQFMASHPDAASPLASLGSVLPLMRHDPRFKEICDQVDLFMMSSTPGTAKDAILKRTKERDALFDVARRTFAADRRPVQTVGVIDQLAKTLWTLTKGANSARVAELTLRLTRALEWHDPDAHVTSDARLSIFKETLRNISTSVDMAALVKSITRLQKYHSFTSLSLDVQNALREVETAQRLLNDFGQAKGKPTPGTGTASSSSTSDTTPVPSEVQNTSSSNDTGSSGTSQSAPRREPKVWDDKSKAPFPNMKWCPRHEKWGSHSEDDCRLPKKARSNAINSAADHTVTLLSSVSEAQCSLKALADSGSSSSFIPETIYKKLSEQGMLASGPSHTIMVAANNTETAAIRQVQLRIRVDRPGQRPDAVEVIETFEVMPSLSQECIISEETSRLLGLLGEAPALDAQVMIDHDDSPEAQTDELFTGRSPDTAQTTPSLLSNVKAEIASHKELWEPLSIEPSTIPAMSLQLVPAAKPVQRRPYWLSPALKLIADEEIDRLLALHIIQKSSSEWAAGMFFVEQGEKLRMVIDYKPLNAFTAVLPVPLLSCNELLSLLTGMKFFATLDLKSGYHQVPMTEKDRHLTAFITHRGLFEFTRVPFGLTNAPAHFQTAMMGVLEGLIGSACLLYVDDILVFGKDEEDFTANLKAVLDRLLSYNIRLGASKCLIGVTSVKFLGNIVSADGISVDPSRLEAIADMKAPRTVSEVRSLLGMVNFYRRFIPGYSTVAEPLINLTRKGVPFTWAEDHDKAFSHIIKLLSASQTLAHPDYTKELIIQSDASGVGIGGVLLQRKAGQPDETVAFVSKTLSATERRWTLNEKEAFALYRSVIEFAPFIRGHHFDIETDHRNLTFLSTSISSKVERWKHRISEHHFAIRFIPGVQNAIADALSRVGHTSIALNQAVSTLPSPNQVDLSSDQKRVILEAAHGNLVSGHRGVNATVAYLREEGYAWTGLNDDVASFVAGCGVCQKYRLRSVMAYHSGHLMADTPFATVSVDSIGPLPAGPDGHQHVLVIIDNFSRWVELAPTHSTDAATCAEILLERVFARHGIPERLHSDNGSQFVNQTIASLTKTLRVKHTRISAYVPEQNGIVERVNASIMTHLRCILASVEEYEDWSKYIPVVQFIVNTSVHSATGVTPHSVLYGDHIRPHRGLLPRLLGEEARPEATPMHEFVNRLKDRLEHVTAIARRHQKDIIMSADRRFSPVKDKFNPGDHVLLTYPKRSKPSKLSPSFMGPFVVTVSRGSHIYEIKSIVDSHVLSVHASRLRRFHSDRSLDDLKKLAAADVQEFVVDDIIEHRQNGTELQFRIRWLGYDESDDTWQAYDEDLIGNAHVETYIDSHGLRSQVGGDCRIRDGSQQDL